MAHKKNISANFWHIMPEKFTAPGLGYDSYDERIRSFGF